MTKAELAKLINNREYGEEITKNIEQLAKDNNLVIVFGYSDDNMEFRGAIHDEVECWEGGFAYLDENGLIENECEEEDCPSYQKLIENAKSIEAIFDAEGYSWVYKTQIPHETFDILEDGRKYCRGIVFDIKELKH